MILQIQQERIKRGWKQQYVANQIGITAEAVCLIENNLRKPSYNVLVKLEDLYNMNHRELFAAVDDNPNLSGK